MTCTHPECTIARPLINYEEKFRMHVYCYLKKCQEDRKAPIKMTNEKHAAKNNARSKKSYHDKKAKS